MCIDILFESQNTTTVEWVLRGCGERVTLAGEEATSPR